MSKLAEQPLIIAIPKGRIYDELEPFMQAAEIVPEADFFNKDSRALRFMTNRAGIELIRVRSFDVPTFVAYGGAHIGVAGSDVLLEFDYPNLYAPLDLGIGKCRLSVAEPKETAKGDDPSSWSHIRIATKYPHLTQEHFAKRGVQAEVIKLNGAMELAPTLGLSERIVDLVSTGSTLKANDLVEVEQIMDISSRLIVNRAALKTRRDQIQPIIDAFAGAVESHAKAA